jgi:TRAP-type C4-dicarboxylate transport system permease small subunit
MNTGFTKTRDIMAAVAFVNILSRYIFHFSLAFTEEITVNLFVWMTVIGIGIAFERGAQMGMVTLLNMFPPKMRRVIVAASAVMGCVLFACVNIFLIRSMYQEITIFHARSGALNIPVWIYYLGVPVFSVFVFAGIVTDAMKRLRTIEGDGE